MQRPAHITLQRGIDHLVLGDAGLARGREAEDFTRGRPMIVFPGQITGIFLISASPGAPGDEFLDFAAFHTHGITL
jgi:hypothetical protein